LHSTPIGVDSQNTESSTFVRADNFDYVDTARAVIQAYVADGYPSARKTASLLDTSERSLFRMLADRSISYQTLVDEVRFDAAKKLLQEQELPQSEIASCLGFTDPANFSRMFRRIGGLSPRDFRKSIRTSLQH
jgi:AraC-like DNA-binding protein